MAEQYVYFFGGGNADGHRDMKELLGGKGAGLAEMTNAALPVPPGFTIATTACNLYSERGGSLPREIDTEIENALQRLEKLMGKELGDASDPLLVSVRSGAKFSMPGMMDTILNLGIGDEVADGLARAAGDERFAWDSYRRFVQMFGEVVIGVPGDVFEHALSRRKADRGGQSDTDLSPPETETRLDEDDPLFQALVRHTLERELIRRRELRAHVQLGVRLDADRKTIDAAHQRLRAQYDPATYTRFGADTVRIAERIVALLDDSHAYMSDATPCGAANVPAPLPVAKAPTAATRTRQMLSGALDRLRKLGR